MIKESLRAKKLDGLVTLYKKKILNLFKNEIISFDNYLDSSLKVIGLPGYQHSDCIVRDKYSYIDWVNCYKEVPIIKVESIKKKFPLIKYNHGKILNIHLFVSQVKSYSFDWHSDSVNVNLHVLKGKKKVYVKNKILILESGNSIFIPKGYKHKVLSDKDTWALSIGYK